MALDRLDESKALLRDATAHGIDFISLRRMAYLTAFLENDSTALARELDLTRATQESMWAFNWAARTSAFSGEFQTAHQAFQLGVPASNRDHPTKLGPVDDGGCRVAGNRGALRRGSAGGGARLELGRDNFTLERGSHTLALCDAGAESSMLSDELARRFSSATLTSRIQLPVTAAALAVRRGDPVRALNLLEPVRPYNRAPAAEFWPEYLRGQAYLQMQDGQAARGQFESILSRRGQAPTSPLYPLACLGLGRAAAMTGDSTQAREAYHAFLALWDGADPALEPVQDARREYTSSGSTLTRYPHRCPRHTNARKDLFLAAVDLPAGDRDAFLSDACVGRSTCDTR